MYIITRNVRIKEAALEAYIVEGTEITFHLTSGTEITIDYSTSQALENAVQCLDKIITSK